MTAPRFELTSQRQKVSRLPTEPPGRPAVVLFAKLFSRGTSYRITSSPVLGTWRNAIIVYCTHGRCDGTRDAGSIVAESLVALYRVGTHQIRRRRRAARSSTSQGSAEPLCARIKGANREVSEGQADV